VISKGFFIYFCPNRQIIVGFIIKLSDSVLKSTESLNKSKGAVNTHRNASSDGGSKPTGYKMIRCHLIYDVKHDARHKSRLVAGGHLTDTPLDIVYSGVVSQRSVKMITFLAEHNVMELWATDIGNAYLEAYTSEKVCIIAEGEFGELAGHLLVIVKALYGFKSSGLR
jgi:hypothetical protein